MELLSNNTTIIVETDSNHLPGTIVTNLILGAYPTKTKLENLQHVGFSWDTTGKYHQQKLTKSRNKNLQYTNNSLKKAQLEGAQHHNHEITDSSRATHQQKSLKKYTSTNIQFSKSPKEHENCEILLLTIFQI